MRFKIDRVAKRALAADTAGQPKDRCDIFVCASIFLSYQSVVAQ